MKPGSKRLLHRLLFAALAVCTLVALFYAEEDWRGMRVWTQTRHDLKARGESLDFNDFIPPAVPDDQNLAMAPLFKRLFQYEIDPRTGALTFSHGGEWYKTDTYQLIRDMPFGPAKIAVAKPVFQDWKSGHPYDLAIAQRYYRQRPEFPHAAQSQKPADDVLLALTRYAPILDELARAAAERPLTRFPVNYTLRPAWGISLPHFADLQSLIKTLSLRAVAELAVGQVPAARRDVEQTFRLRGTMEDEPTLIAALVDETSLNVLMQPLWKGLSARQWSAEDLDTLSKSLRGINLLREYQRTMRAERTLMAARWPVDLQNASQAREMAKDLPNGTVEGLSSSTWGRWLWRALPYWPRGWFAQNAAIASRDFQDYWIDTVDPASHRIALARRKDAERAMKDMPLAPGTMLAKIALPVFTNIVEKFAQGQTMLDQAVIACALEKYHLDHQTYPAALAALIPGYLDRVLNDVIDGAPMRYRLTVDGRYQLYSIGWDGRDEGGAIAWPADRLPTRPSAELPPGREQTFASPSRDQGDWVWQYAPADPPAPSNNESRLESWR